MLNPSKIRYVSVLACSPCQQEVVLLLKLKGPAHLINKWTMPGGKVDADDISLAHAAARELREETGVTVDPNDMIQIHEVINAEYEWTMFYVATDISSAVSQPNEVEPIRVAQLAEVRRAVYTLADNYASDFAQVLLAMPGLAPA